MNIIMKMSTLHKLLHYRVCIWCCWHCKSLGLENDFWTNAKCRSPGYILVTCTTHVKCEYSIVCLHWKLIVRVVGKLVASHRQFFVTKMWFGSETVPGKCYRCTVFVMLHSLVSISYAFRSKSTNMYVHQNLENFVSKNSPNKEVHWTIENYKHAQKWANISYASDFSSEKLRFEILEYFHTTIYNWTANLD